MKPSEKVNIRPKNRRRSWRLPLCCFSQLPLFPLPASGAEWQSKFSRSMINSAKPPVLSQRLEVVRASISWAQMIVAQHHYLHKPVFARADPIGYAILLDGQAIGTIICATPNFIKQQGLFGYPGLPTQWQVLCLSRLWIHPDVQGRKVVDRKGRSHCLPLAGCAISKLLKRVQADWLEHHPPPFSDQPHDIRLIIAYADPSVGHSGSIYKAAGFQFHGWTKPSKSGVKGTRGTKDGHRKKRFIKRLPPATPTVDGR